jgi:hypothetical protein
MHLRLERTLLVTEAVREALVLQPIELAAGSCFRIRTIMSKH